MELKITSEKVLEAASKCGDAKNVLKTLFPEVFVEARQEIIERFLKIIPVGTTSTANIFWLTDANDCTEIKHSSLGLSNQYNWEIKELNGVKRLIPTKK